MRHQRPAVLLIGDTLNVGGTERQFVEVACGLDRARWDVHLTCLHAVGPLRRRIEAAGLRAWSCGRGSFKSPRVLLAVAGLVRYLRTHRIQLVHSFDFYSNILGMAAARIAGVPGLIASQRELGDIRPALHRRIHALALRLADAVLVNSVAVSERLRRHRIVAPERIVLVLNGVDLERFAGAPSGRPVRWKQPTIGTLAMLRPEKGLDDFVRAAALVRERFPDARFVIWGEGPLKPALARLASEVDVVDALEFRGLTAQPEAALRELDVFVLPSLSEASSNGLLEAMATGLAVVATRVGGNRFLVEDDVTGLLVPPADPPGLAKAVVRLCEDPSLAEQLGAAARDTVRARFGLDRMLSRIQTLYDHTLNRA